MPNLKLGPETGFEFSSKHAALQYYKVLLREIRKYYYDYNLVKKA